MLDIHAPIVSHKGSQGPFMNKTLQKALMTRCSLRNKFLKNKTQYDETAYKKQKNYCVILFPKEKKKFL